MSFLSGKSERASERRLPGDRASERASERGLLCGRGQASERASERTASLPPVFHNLFCVLSLEKAHSVGFACPCFTPSVCCFPRGRPTQSGLRPRFTPSVRCFPWRKLTRSGLRVGVSSRRLIAFLGEGPLRRVFVPVCSPPSALCFLGESSLLGLRVVFRPLRSLLSPWEAHSVGFSCPCFTSPPPAYLGESSYFIL